MNDRELLELAAKASGNTIYSTACLGVRSVMHWNPLDDDADAFRLAVKLGINVFIYDDEVAAAPSRTGTVVKKGSDHYADTRRAIVVAAAEIARDMK